MKLSTYFRCAVLVFSFSILGGCTTYVGKVSKDASYNKKITDTVVVWNNSSNIGIQVTRSAKTAPGVQPVISSTDKSDAQKATLQLLNLFAQSMPDIIGQGLTAQHVKLVASNEQASTQLRIQPIRSDTECAQLGCIYSLWVEVALFDVPLNKVVWSAQFKVGAPFMGKNDESII